MLHFVTFTTIIWLFVFLNRICCSMLVVVSFLFLLSNHKFTKRSKHEVHTENLFVLGLFEQCRK